MPWGNSAFSSEQLTNTLSCRDFSFPEPGPFPVPGTGCGANGPKTTGPARGAFAPAPGPLVKAVAYALSSGA